MASSLYHVKTGTGQTVQGRDFLDTVNTLSEAFARIKLHRAAMIQEKDGNAGDATDFVTPAATYGFCDSGGTLSSAVAKDAFAELDTFVTNSQSALEQFCARLRQ